MSLFVALFLLALGLVYGFRCYALGRGLMDMPGSRSSHRVPTPRGGGMAFAVLWLGVVLFAWCRGGLPLEAMLLVLPGAALVAAAGYGDDRYGLSPLWRILVHFAAALLAVSVLSVTSMNDAAWNGAFRQWLVSLALVLAIVWSINLFNFMDGTDGLAGMEACFVFAVGGWWLWQAGAPHYAFLAWALVAAVAGFLVWNWPPAKIFMGDGGSGFLGFLVAVFALAGRYWWDIPILLWAIVYGVFWFDATVTLLRRIRAGEPWYTAHRAHAYQRLHQAGWSHRQVLLAATAINTLLSAAALWAGTYPPAIPWAFLAALAVLGGAYGGVERLRPMYPG